ncbi:hypothetical protein MBT84_20260 [Streptomyces sp. MBT84]|uniref:TSUP family transporter n=1 Tax=unclassified Streptomyces TaxID=2593676 RepID=UPI001D55E49A|nr:TSUP family transporter [Streptomyces sp. MBT84]MBW8701945.1 hypothetical protein [Streptomyces sp. MBT84]
MLLLGPAQGVVLANCAAGAISAFGLVDGRRAVRLPVMAPLCLAAVITVPAGTRVARQLPEPALLACLGRARHRGGGTGRARPAGARPARWPGRRRPGGLGGFMNSAAGVGGPPVSLYALNAGWTVREFVPNAQFYGVVVNLVSVTSNGLPRLTAPVWAVAVTALAAGALAGRALTGRVPENRARTLVLLLALAGGLSALAKGFAGLT